MVSSFKMVCMKHRCNLLPNGHVAGEGFECWPGINVDYKTGVWSLDTSELRCPELDKLQLLDIEEDDPNLCTDNWEIFPAEGESE